MIRRNIYKKVDRYNQAILYGVDSLENAINKCPLWRQYNVVFGSIVHKLECIKREEHIRFFILEYAGKKLYPSDLTIFRNMLRWIVARNEWHGVITYMPYTRFHFDNATHMLSFDILLHEKEEGYTK